MRIETGLSESAAFIHGIRLTRTIRIGKSCSKSGGRCPDSKKTLMQTHGSIASRSTPRSFLPASARLTAGAPCNSLTRNSPGTSKRGKRTTGNTTTVLQNFMKRSRNLTPRSGRSSLCFWKTSAVRAFLPIFAVFAAALFSTESALGQGTDRYTKVANQLVELINAGDYAAIQTNLNKQMDTALPLDKSSAFFNGLTQQMGKIQKLSEPRSVGGAMVFSATFEKGMLDMQIALDSRGLIAGLLFKPHVATKAEPERHQTQLSLTEGYTKVANQLVELINATDYAGIQTHFNKEMDAALPLDKSSAFFNGLTQQMGKIQKLGEPRPVGEAMVYPATFEKGTLDMQIALDSRGLIAGLTFTPHVATKAEPDKHQTQLSLPFKGRWLVFWGGDTRELNQHHEVPNQRFAFDLLAVGEDGKTQRRDGTRNEDYYAFGREVLAPADGTVVEVIEGVYDNAPGSMNPYSAVGNCVVIQHREEEVSVLAHFKQGSIVVKVGDKVNRGQLLGQCGNSGNSSEPHVHYHLQNSPVLQDGLGIKCIFQKVVVTEDGKTETRTDFSPVKGEIISPPVSPR
jgi:murein DD-endopeptidase MepM/ murein hydrolase activator NlpD